MKKFVIPWIGRLCCEEELVTVLIGLNINKASGADSVVNEFLKYGGSVVGNSYLRL